MTQTDKVNIPIEKKSWKISTLYIIIEMGVFVYMPFKIMLAYHFCAESASSHSRCREYMETLEW